MYQKVQKVPKKYQKGSKDSQTYWKVAKNSTKQPGVPKIDTSTQQHTKIRLYDYHRWPGT